jgi:alpha-tubulin suppressor-like RCC1 family protein
MPGVRNRFAVNSRCHVRTRRHEGCARALVSLVVALAPVVQCSDAWAGPKVVDIESSRSSSTMCALFDDGRVKCWGENGAGQLGLGDTADRGDSPKEMGDQLPFVDLGPNSRVAQLALGQSHVCARLVDGGVKCWGDNSGGYLGLGDTNSRGDNPGEMGAVLPRVALGTDAKVKSIAAGDAHTCALLQSGQVKCWGLGIYGATGLGNELGVGEVSAAMGDALQPVDLGQGAKAVAIAAGMAHTCALLEGGAVKCWGWNCAGQLGLGDDQNRGDQPGEMGDSLPAVRLGAGQQIVAIEAVDMETCALAASGRVFCWGAGNLSGRYFGDSAGSFANGIGARGVDMGDALKPVSTAADAQVKQLRLGATHACALLEGGGSSCWGMNYDGELGWWRFARDDADSNLSAGLFAHEDVHQLGGRWKLKSGARLDLGSGGNAIDLALGGQRDTQSSNPLAGTGYTCALGSDHAVRCWGGNKHGVLGHETTNRREPTTGMELPETCLLGPDCARREAARKAAVAKKDSAPVVTTPQAPDCRSANGITICCAASGGFDCAADRIADEALRGISDHSVALGSCGCSLR